ncbi:dienelactone hydrolase family protein [Gemmata sp.]|uniref:dienelactone hydrolase family protein n=1 Tax=Gemmata sp. TaxID=1914242 RepID=UPI003F71B774
MRVAALLVLLLPAVAHSQPERPQRYEVGRRLKAFEAAWEKVDDPAARGRALAVLPNATKQFFALNLGEAGRTLDLATFALASDAGPSAGRQWVWSLDAAPEHRVLDGAARELSVTVRPLYPVKGEWPKALELQLWFTNKDVVTVRPREFPVTVKLPVPPLGDARGLDRKLYFLADGAKELRPVAVGVSQVADLKARVAALAKAADAWEKLETIEQATVRDRSRVLAGLVAGDAPDSDLPAAGLLTNAEAMLDGEPFFTPARHGQFWLSVPLGAKKSAPCRVYVPKGLDPAKPVPVVVALHGIGVGASAFFEAYGAGRIVKECEDRRWVLIAPECGLGLTGPPVAEIVAKLGARYPLDPKRVFLVGHSMGAARALELAATGKYAGVAALGGGGRLAKPEALAAVPVFVGVGDKDPYALAGARGLNAALAAASAKALTYKEYPGVEHLVIVREALPDAFAVFDRAAAK